MFKKKALYMAVGAIAVTAALTQVSLADTMTSRRQAAAEYEKIVPVEKIVDDLLGTYESDSRLQLSSSDLKEMRDAYNFRELRKTMIDTMAEHFKTEEIETLVAFYKQPAAQSAMEKMPNFMNAFLPQVQKPIMDHMQGMMREQMQAR